jgi:hypothetical protein
MHPSRKGSDQTEVCAQRVVPQTTRLESLFKNPECTHKGIFLCAASITVAMATRDAVHLTCTLIAPRHCTLRTAYINIRLYLSTSLVKVVSSADTVNGCCMILKR